MKRMQVKEPNFIIIGAAKCGTTALATILGTHPECCMSRPKEVSFFQDTMDFKPNPNYKKGWGWYKQFFNHYRGEKLVGEATPSYSDRTRSPNTAKYIFDFNPDMNLIYMVRNPLERQISEWKMQWYEGVNGIWPERRETKWALKGFPYWLNEQRNVGQWDVCKYSYQLEAYLKFFNNEKILVSFLEDWKTDQKKEVYKVFEFLGLNCSNVLENDIFIKTNTSGRTNFNTGFKIIKNNYFWKKLKNHVPSKIKDVIQKSFAQKHVIYPYIDYQNVVVKEFLDYLSIENSLFLKSYGKPIDFWSKKKLH